MELHISCCKEIYLSVDLIDVYYFFFNLVDINKTKSLFPFYIKKKKKVILFLLMIIISGVFNPSM